MTMRHRLRSGSARRGFATITSAALLLSMMAVPATAEHFENTEVLDADNAVEAGVNWSEFTFDSATDVALGRNDKFPDNLASAVIQGTDTPLLYTDSDSLSEETAAELDRLGAETIHVLGGDEAISEDVVDELEDLGYETHRDSGETRIETAIDIASKHADDATHALIVRAFGDAGGDETRAWADALAAGGWAAEEGWPVLLTQTEELNDNVAAYIEDSAIESATIIGGVNAVSAAVASDLEALGVEVDRVSGPNRFATAVAIAAERGFDDAGDATEVILSEGQQSDAWAGGFAAAAYSAISGAPIVLSNGETIPPETEEFLEGAGGDGSVALVCGPFVEPEACAEAASILGQEEAAHTNQSFTVTPAEKATNVVSAGPTGTDANRGARTFTVTGLDDTKTYDIELHEATDIVNSGETVTFKNGTAQATGNVSIETVNGANVGTADAGAATEAREVHNVSPVNGTITFTVDSVEQGLRLIPVISEDTDGDNALDFATAPTATAPQAPSEPFGIGGEKEWVATEALSGEPTDAQADHDVSRVDTASDFFVAEDDASAGVGTFRTFNYDANDIFQIATAASGVAGDDAGAVCVQVNMATFESNLSVADELDVSSNYNTDPAFSSTFCLEDLTPGSPTAVTATASVNTVTVTWSAPASGADSYNIYRAADAGNDGCDETPPSEDATYQKVGTSTTTSFTESNVANGNYCYAVTAVLDGDESAVGAGADDEDDVDTPETDATAPTAVANASAVDTDTGFNDVLDTGDVIVAHFNEAPVLNNPALIVTDGTDIATIDSSNATFTVSGTTLTVTLTGSPTDNNTTTGDNAMGIPATISNDRGITDASGNRAVFTDATLEDDGPEFYTETCDIAETTCTVTFNEALNKTAAETEANWTYDPDGGANSPEDPASAVLSADGRTVTFIFTSPVAGGATLDPEATILDTEGQAATQGATAIA